MGQAPLVLVLEDPHEGPRKPSDSFLTVKGSGVIVSAVKVAEEGQGIIVRLYETDGAGGPVEVTLKTWRKTWKGGIGKHEILTLRFDRSAPAQVVNLLEM